MYLKNNNRWKNGKGITLVALVISIIVLLILAGVTIMALSGDNGILTNASYAKFAMEVKNIEEQVKLKVMQTNYEITGKIDEELDIKSQYNDLLYIEDGELVYVVDKASQQK